MKRTTLAIFAMFLITNIFGQRKDTSYIVEGKYLYKVVIVSHLEFEGISPKAFSEDEVKILEKGGFVKKVTARGKYLISIFPLVQTMDRITVSIFQKSEAGKVKKTNDAFPIGSPKENYRQPIFGMYLPFLLIFLIAYFNSEDEKRIGKFIKFSLTSAAALAIAIVFGRFSGTMPGGFIGIIIVGVVATFIGRLTNVFGGVLLLMMFAGGLSGGFVGNLAQMPGVIWRYIPIYITVCVFALTFQELVVSFRESKPSKKQDGETEKTN